MRLKNSLELTVAKSGYTILARSHVEGIILGIYCSEVVVVYNDMLRYLIALVLTEVDIESMSIVKVTVYNEEGELFALLVLNKSTVKVRNVAVLLGLVATTVEYKLNGSTLSVLSTVSEGIVDGLRPCTVITRHNGRDNVYELSLTAYLYSVSVLEHGDETVTYYDNVLHAVGILDLMRSLCPVLVRILSVRTVYYVPLVDRDVDLLLFLEFSSDVITASDNVLDLTLKSNCRSEEGTGIVGGLVLVIVVCVQRYVITDVVGILYYGCIP